MTKKWLKATLALAMLPLSTVVLAQADDFASAMDAAMARMHGAMMTGYSGNPDHDFARMMIPHHQGAIEMAEIELRYGKDERLRRLRASAHRIGRNAKPIGARCPQISSFKGSRATMLAITDWSMSSSISWRFCFP